MHWILIVGAVLVGIVALVLLVGSLLPREHVAASSIVLRQPRETVWQAVRDIGSAAHWWKEVKTTQRAPNTQGRECWEQVLKNGFTLRLIVTEERPPERLVTMIDAAANAPFGGTWTYELAKVDGGTKLTVTERGYINNGLFRFISRFILGYYATQDGYLKALGKKLGEDVRPVHEQP